MTKEFWRLTPSMCGSIQQGEALEPGAEAGGSAALICTVTDWSGDDLFMCPPIHLVTEWLGDGLEEEGLTGFRLREVENTSKTAHPLGATEDPEVGPIRFLWLDVHGEAGRDDLGVTESSVLIVSRVAVDLLIRYKLGHCGLEVCPEHSAEAPPETSC